MISSWTKHGIGRATPGRERDAFRCRRDAADGGAVDARAATRGDDGGGLARLHREQERPRRDGAERVEPEGLAQDAPLAQHGNALAVHAQAHAGGLGHFPARRRHAALRRVVHGVHARRRAGEPCLGHHADARPAQEPACALDHVGGDAATPRLVTALPREDGRALERRALGQEQRVAHARAARRHQPILGHLAQHAAGHDDARQPRGHLRVAAHQGHAQLRARRGELPEQRLDARLGRLALGQEHRGEEPQRARAAHGQVIGVHVQRVPARLVGREGDGIGRRHQVAIPHVDDRGVLAHPRTHHHARVLRHVLVEEALEQLGAQLAHRQPWHGSVV